MGQEELDYDGHFCYEVGGTALLLVVGENVK